MWAGLEDRCLHWWWGWSWAATLLKKYCLCAKKIPPTLLHQQQDKMLIQRRMDPDLYVVYAKFSPRGFHSRTLKLRRWGTISFPLSSLIFNFGRAAPVRGLLLQAPACERGFNTCLFEARPASCPVWPSTSEPRREQNTFGFTHGPFLLGLIVLRGF